MNPTPLLRLYAAMLLLVFGLIVLHAPLTVWLGTLWPDYALGIKAWKEIMLLLAFLLATFLVTRQRLWKKLLSDRILQLCLCYGVLHGILLPWRPQGALAAVAGLMIDLRYVAFFVLVYVLVQLWPGLRHQIVKIAAAGAAFVVSFALLQTVLLPGALLEPLGYGRDTIQPYLTVDKNSAFIRQNSTLRGPNPLGAYAGVTLLLLGAFLWQYRQKLSTQQRALSVLLGMAALVALVVSYSRSAWIGFGVAAFAGGLLVMRRRVARPTWIGLIIVVMALAGGLALGRENSTISTLFFHDNPTGSQSKSDSERINSLSNGLQRAIQQPLGAGVGSTGSASLQSDRPFIVENQYLFIVHETGWLGLSLFVWLFVEIMCRLWRRRRDWLAFGTFLGGINLAIIGFMLPVWVDDTVSLVWWGLAAAALGSVHLGHDRARQKPANQKAKRIT